MAPRPEPGAEPLRVLVVDDSQSVRAVLKRFFSWTDDLVVVGEAADGEEAVARVRELEPDVVLMDLVMPVMDGYAATERIMEVAPTPIVVLSSTANRNQMRIAFEAIRRGAVEVLGKPEDTGSWHQLAATLPEMVRTAARARLGATRRRRAPRRAPARPTPRVTESRTLRWVGVGASTGGPAALRELFETLPAALPASMLIVQHITAGFEEGLADWLNREFPQDVGVATDGEVVRLGTVRLAPAGSHLTLEPGGVLRLDRSRRPIGGHRPAIDALFESMAGHAAASSAGVLLTGMGTDGVDGLAALRAAGGLALVQDRESSVVYGMPRAAAERGIADVVLPPREIGRHLSELWARPGSVAS